MARGVQSVISSVLTTGSTEREAIIFADFKISEDGEARRASLTEREPSTAKLQTLGSEHIGKHPCSFIYEPCDRGEGPWPLQILQCSHLQNGVHVDPSCHRERVGRVPGSRWHMGRC